MSSGLRHWIYDSLEMLMTEKEIENIRVEELCEAAGIQPVMFSFYFKDLYDVLAWNYFRIGCSTEEITPKNIERALRKLRRIYYECTESYSEQCCQALWQYIPEYIIRKYRKNFWIRTKNILLQSRMEFNLELYWKGATEMFRQWVTSKKQPDESVMTKRLLFAMSQDMKDVFFDT